MPENPMNQRNHPDNPEFHDHLDRKLTSEAFTDAPCGSPNAQTGRPEYCSPECPTLKAKILADAHQ